MSGVTIVGTGRYLPGEPVTNHALARVMDTSDEWIRTYRHLAAPLRARRRRRERPRGEASQRAIAAAGLEPGDIDYIIFATMTPDPFPVRDPFSAPSSASPACPRSTSASSAARCRTRCRSPTASSRSGAAETILLVGAEAHAGFMPWSDWGLLRSAAEGEVSPEAYERANRHRGLAVVFGDGAAAMVLRQSQAPDSGFLGAELHSDGNAFDHLYVPGCGFRSIPYVTPQALLAEEHIPQMRGPSLLKKAVQTLSRTVKSICETHGISQDEIDCFIAHQANDRINRAVRDSLRIPPEKIPSNIARYGNTSAATIGILTDELRHEGRIREGDLLCFLALGAGLNWGAALLRL